MSGTDNGEGTVSGSATPTTYCDRDRVDNVWVEGANVEGAGGICLLDTMTEPQIVGVLKVDERARADLLRVTSNQDLIDLANTVEPLPQDTEEERLQATMNANDKPESIPFYAIFRGQPPFSQ